MNLVPRIVELEGELTAWRRDFHAHPELGYEERRTSELVAERLASFGIEVHRGLAGTGVVGTLRGKLGDGPAIGLRADMDALPMDEMTNLPHASKHAGRMHACGHDGHTTMLLGAARYLAETRNFKGTVHFIFQPAEEMLCGGERMVKEGLFDLFPCSQVYGMHNSPSFAPGQIGVRAGPVLAAADTFEITLTGRGGHGAFPHTTIDPVVVGAHVITALQTLISRQLDPIDSGVVSVTRMHAGSADNVIPPHAILGGTTRAFRPETRAALIEGVHRIANSVAHALRAEAEVRFSEAAYPPTIATEAEAQHAAAIAAKVVGDAGVIWDHPPIMGGEDFAFMLQKVPGAFVMLGGDGGDDPIMCHDPRFDFNDATLKIGASFWARLVEETLSA
ncbi:MAG: amidohydrolase [Geminicoccaceae bacterium]|nr:MAG: amidohydrolase [Geminicoccaceae bacterium]